MTDIISTVSTAITLASRLREISKNIENAEFKNILADLSIELAEAKLRIADLITENGKLKSQVDLLSSSSHDLCPKCKKPAFELTSSKPHSIFGGAVPFTCC